MSRTVDLLVRDAALVATCDEAGRELPGGWVAVTDGLITGVGAASEPMPEAARTIDAAGCLVTPGLVNTHHHLYQNLTRAFAPAVNGTLFEWLTRLYPVWAGTDEEASYLAAWVGLAELALGGCTSTADHLYIAPRAGGDLWAAEIAAAREVGVRFHPTRGSSSNMILGNGRVCPVPDLRAAGTPVGLGCDGSSSNDMASLWLEARTALLLGKVRGGAAAATARDALHLATRGGAACLGRAGEIGELTAGACGDLVVWAADPIAHAGACTDAVEAWLRCGPGRARETVVAGRVLVDDGALTLAGIDDVLSRHRAVAMRLQHAQVG